MFSHLSWLLTTPQYNMPVCIAVHRKELVSQISMTLASFGIIHNIIASKPTIRGIIAEQRREFKKQFYSYKANVTVVSVDTLNSRIDQHRQWANNIMIWVVDEAAHLLAENKWGRLVSHFPNARGLGVTATPQRLDRQGLGRHAKGVFDIMVHGPEVRWLIDEGYLADYEMAFPKTDYEAYLRKAISDHDFTNAAMAEADSRPYRDWEILTFQSIILHLFCLVPNMVMSLPFLLVLIILTQLLLLKILLTLLRVSFLVLGLILLMIL